MIRNTPPSVTNGDRQAVQRRRLCLLGVSILLCLFALFSGVRLSAARSAALVSRQAHALNSKWAIYITNYLFLGTFIANLKGSRINTKLLMNLIKFVLNISKTCTYVIIR